MPSSWSWKTWYSTSVQWKQLSHYQYIGTAGSSQHAKKFVSFPKCGHALWPIHFPVRWVLRSLALGFKWLVPKAAHVVI